MTAEMPGQTEPVVSPRERRMARLGASAHSVILQRALATLPPRWIIDGYKSHFRARDEAQSFRLVHMPFRKVTHTAVINALSRLREQRPEIVDHLTDLFMIRYERALGTLAEGGVPDGEGPETLQLLYWILDEELEPEQRAQGLASMAAALRTVRAELADGAERHRRAQDELHDLRQRLDDAQQHLKQVQAQHDSALSSLRRDHADAMDRSAVQHRRQEQETQEQHETVRAQLEARVTDLEDEVARVGDERQGAEASELRELRTQLTDLKEQRRSPTIEVQALQGALILDYEQCGQAPAQRLLGLFQAYRAFLEGRADERLDRASNLAALGQTAPSGLLLLGLERMLEDGAGLPLERYLASRLFQQEAKLHRLIDPVESPRLRDQT